MHIKFISRGKGSAKDAETYLLQEHDHKGEVRQNIEVLRGNPSHVSELADSLEFEHRYTSGVIAWHVDDNPTEGQIAQVLNDFEKVAFAGLDANQYSWYAVLHEESNGAKHIHVVSARVELSTGKSMNIAPPNWQKTYDVLVDKYNVKHDWASPKDLHRRKLVNNQVSIHSNMSHTKAKIEINKAVMELVGRGAIQNENDVIKYLNSIDGVTVKPRRSKKTLSIELEGIKKPIKLEGLAYGKGFDVRELRQELRAEQTQRAGQSTADRSREYERVSTVLESIIDGRATFNRGRYDQKAQHPKRQDERSPSEHHQGRERNSKDLTHQPKGDRGREPKPDAELEQNQDKVLASSLDSGRIIDTGANTRNVSPWELDNKPVPRPTDTKSRDSRSEEAQGSNRQSSSSSEDLQQRARVEEEARRMARRQRELGSAIRESERAINDTVRARVTADIESTRRVIQERVRESNTAVRQELGGLQDQLQSDSIRSADHHREAERGVKAIRESKSEHKDTLRRQSGDSLDRASRGLEEPIKQARGRVSKLGDSVRDIGKWFGEVGEKVIAKVKEISRRVQQSQSWGISR